MARTPALERVEKMYLEGFPDPATATVDDLREAYDRLFLQFALPEGVEPSEDEVGGVPVLRVAAEGAAEDKVLVWFHGGGNIMGSARGFQELGHNLSRASGVTAILADFRRAPEHPFPAASDDTVAVISALVERHGAHNVAVGGDSAGGGLVLGALVALRDKGENLPAAAVFISPLLDLTASGDSIDEFDGKDIAVSRGSIGNVSAAYLQGHDPADPQASPLFAELKDLPPALFMVGSGEVLRDDSRRAAAKIVEAGGSASVSLYDDMVHVWPLFSSILPEGIQAADEAGAFLRKNLSV
ncbi:alpha/beta hydrolase [Gordonia terrae]|uniref:Alpha/beta hydrolase n=2 Tax=Gordonia terrae TaxID=2055 RepID=A0AAD0K822_9ACTN|nr:alpha/beta hydrolase [Gordonia terrae]VTR10519.1 acetyl-hydrolase [Clostridioides difficile]ANY24141.1 alpha/beta hydrolase [Gordonia terrae]AWO84884.1 alpha/beta hydrolase [Gordonia terrae]VTS57270.1 Monoterpene epsilon-lactone hydrolase [Gordonia terrae]GAB46153.1 putative hydrolase [Gordonia terrae NBRC 100016]